LNGKAEELAASLGLTAFSVSISHTRQIAAATVTALGLPEKK
jgi:phosphopantetheinyl transferase (holo-ACP synthase)